MAKMAMPRPKKAKPEVSPEAVAACDAWYWAYMQKLELQAGTFTPERHEYQVDPMQCEAPVRVQQKGSQMGFTEGEVIRSLHGMIHAYYKTGVLYLFPTERDVSDFSKARFNPLILNNPQAIGSFVRTTDAVNIKQIAGAFLYLRGARSTLKVSGLKPESARLRSAPVDKLVCDELDLMEPKMVELAKQRLSHSEIHEEAYLSTPTIPDFGIDKLYQQFSDQRVWMIRCQHCGKHTCLEREFPKSLVVEADGNVYRACIHCRKEIYPHDGSWQAQFPSRSKECAGWWISQLNSVFVAPAKIWKAFTDPPDGNVAEVYNSMLATAYIAAENRLTREAVLACCGGEPMQNVSEGTCMGVDVGNLLHVVVGYQVGQGQYRIIHIAEVPDWSDVHDLARDLGVQSAVIDMKPELHKAREFQNLENYPVYLCDYSEYIRTSPEWVLNDHIVKVNRTEICDQTHALVVSGHQLVLPRRCEAVNRFAEQVSNMAKVLTEDAHGGGHTYRYRKLADDHYRHALNYLWLACERMGVRRDLTGQTRKEPEMLETEYDVFAHV